MISSNTAVFFIPNRMYLPSVQVGDTFALSSSDFVNGYTPSLYSSGDAQSFDSTTSNSIIPTSMAFSLHKNINLPWFAATGLAVWFLFIHTPSFWINRKLITRDVILAIHIIAASTIYLSCAHNCMFTPSFTNIFGKSSKFMHIWVGRVGMVAGIISFSLGAFLAWSRLGVDTVGGTTLAFAIPITIGGIAQLNAQYNGYLAIRQYKSLEKEIAIKIQQTEDISISKEQKIYLIDETNNMRLSQRKALRKHIGNMISLFVSACGIPAGIRLAELVTGGSDGVVTIFAIMTIIVALSLIGVRYVNMMLPELSAESNVSFRDGYTNIH
jgi:hypothetical protein